MIHEYMKIRHGMNKLYSIGIISDSVISSTTKTINSSKKEKTITLLRISGRLHRVDSVPNTMEKVFYIT